MKKKKDDSVYLKSMLDAISMIEQHRHADRQDETVNHAIVYRLITIGEASTQITPELRNHYPEVQWRIIADTRNRLVHGYLEVDYQKVWSIVDNYLPQLRTQIETIIRKEEGN